MGEAHTLEPGDYGDRSFDECAALIGAAPALLAAAKAHLQAREALSDTPVQRLSLDDARFAAVTDTLADLRAAIALAEGREP